MEWYETDENLTKELDKKVIEEENEYTKEVHNIFKKVRFYNIIPVEYIRISGVYKLCPRLFYYNRKLYYNRKERRQEKVSKQGWLSMELGSWVHDKIQNDILADKIYGKHKCLNCGWKGEKLGNVCELCGEKTIFKETEVYSKELKLKGHFDGYLYLKNERFCIEIKTTNDYNFNQFKLSESYKWQANSYMKLLGEDKILFIILNMDELLKRKFVLKVIEYRYDKEIWQEVEKKCRYIWECVEKDILPERDCEEKGKGKSRNCPFRNECFSE